MSSRFVVSTLNGMFIAQLAAWMTAPTSAATVGVTPCSASQTVLLSRADDDPSPSLGDEWEIVIPEPPNQPVTSVASGMRQADGKSQGK